MPPARARIEGRPLGSWCHVLNIEEAGILWGMKLLVGAYRYVGRWLFLVLLYPVIIYYVLTNRIKRVTGMQLWCVAELIASVSSRFPHPQLQP